MNGNPLPNHGNAINAIDGESIYQRKRHLSEADESYIVDSVRGRKDPAGIPGSQH